MAVDLLEFEQFREELPRSKIFGSSPRSDKIWTHQERRNAINGMAEGELPTPKSDDFTDS